MKPKKFFVLCVIPFFILVLLASCGRKEPAPTPPTNDVGNVESEMVPATSPEPIPGPDPDSCEWPPLPADSEILSEEETPSETKMVAIIRMPPGEIIQHYLAGFGAGNWLTEFSYQRGNEHRFQYRKFDHQVTLQLQPVSPDEDSAGMQLTLIRKRLSIPQETVEEEATDAIDAVDTTEESEGQAEDTP